VVGLPPPPRGPYEPGNFPPGSDRPFLPGLPLSVLRRFSFCGSSLSLSAISGAWSPHPKIPFLADKALAGGCGFVERSHSRRIHDGQDSERLIFRSCRPEERVSLSLTNSGYSRTVPYGPARCPLGSLWVQVSDAHAPRAWSRLVATSRTDPSLRLMNS
jgi:hypothetical protein